MHAYIIYEYYSGEYSIKPRYWIGVVSKSHVERGVAGNFAQLSHGKSAPLRRMSVGDWLIYYSPKTDMADGQPLQQFTAIGKVVGESVYEYVMSETFTPFRREIAYIACKPAEIQLLISQLSFIKDSTRWGYPFRTGHFEITHDDFQLIAQAMEANIHE